MKVQLLAVIAALFMIGFMVGCNQSSVDPNADASTLTTARIGSVSNSSAVSGTCVKGSSETVISAASLPTAVTTYLTTNFPGYALVQAEQGTNQNGGATYYEVTFTYNGATRKLHFDMTGAVIAGGGKRGNHGRNNEVVITADQLPATALTYLSTTYAGYTLVEAERGTDRTGATYYEVKFTVNGATKKIYFNASGAVL